MTILEERFAERWAANWDQMDALGIPTARPRQQAEKLGCMALAHRCLAGQRCSDGFQILLEKNRLDLSLEALALQSPWGALFTDQEANEALTRLLEVGYTFR